MSQSDCRDMVIETLADSEAQLPEQVVEPFVPGARTVRARCPRQAAV